MKNMNKSKMTVIILFVLMLISIALLLVFIFMAVDNLEERKGATSEIEPVIEEEISFNEIPAAWAEFLNIEEQETSDLNWLDVFWFNFFFENEDDSTFKQFIIFISHGVLWLEYLIVMGYITLRLNKIRKGELI